MSLRWPFGVGLASWFFAWAESSFAFYPGLPPWAELCRPFGAGFGAVCHRSSIEYCGGLSRDLRFPPFAQNAKDGPPVITLRPRRLGGRILFDEGQEVTDIPAGAGHQGARIGTQARQGKPGGLMDYL